MPRQAVFQPDTSRQCMFCAGSRAGPQDRVKSGLCAPCALHGDLRDDHCWELAAVITGYCQCRCGPARVRVRLKRGLVAGERRTNSATLIFRRKIPSCLPFAATLASSPSKRRLGPTTSSFQHPDNSSYTTMSDPNDGMFSFSLRLNVISSPLPALAALVDFDAV